RARRGRPAPGLRVRAPVGGLDGLLIGDGLTWVSLVWLVYELGGGPAEIGLLAACYSGPVIIGGLAAGVLLDRFDRRTLLMADNAIRGLTVLSIPIAAAAGALTLPHLYVVAAIYGLLYMTSLAGFPTMLPDLVEPDELPTANAMESLGFGIGGIVGPILAGLLITVVGPTANLVIDALTYLVFVACLALVRLPPRATPAATTTSTAPDGVGLRPAFAFALRTPAILATTLMFMSANETFTLGLLAGGGRRAAGGRRGPPGRHRPGVIASG
ncbi:MAG TPA: MFS transporter, partial [Candidatus Limnocylindrales bacterium]